MKNLLGITSLTLAGLVALGMITAAASARPAGDYQGSAKQLLLWASEAKYDQRTDVRSIRSPSARYRSALKATYLDRGVDAPRATLTVYVYPPGPLAAAAFKVKCPANRLCTKVGIKGHPEIQTKAVQYRQGKARCVLGTSFRKTVYVRVTTCAAERGYGFTKLRFDAGYLIGGVYGKAMRREGKGSGSESGSRCDPSYPGVCIPAYPADLDCDDVPYSGFSVVGSDPHGFDGDGDGVGCES